MNEPSLICTFAWVGCSSNLARLALLLTNVWEFYEELRGIRQPSRPILSVDHGEIVPMTSLILDTSAAEPYAPLPLDEQQQSVVDHRFGAMRVLAGPGTGKTTTLVAAMAARISGSDALRPDQVLGLTFGRKAALNWRDDVTAAVGGGIVPTVSTFHSFCYALLRKFAENDAYEIATRLLSGPEQQVRAQALFIQAVNEGRLSWPEELRSSLTTRGLAEEVRAVMAQTRSRLMDPVDLAQLGESSGRPLWIEIGKFMDEYLDVLGFEEVIDYSELIYRAVLLAQEPQVREYLNNTFKAIYVDEYQDTDPGQVALLKAMVTAETSLVVVGDVDQAIYGFRGADESGIRNFKADFAPIYGERITDVVLNSCRRFGTTIRAAARAVIGDRVPAGFADADIFRHRSPVCESKNPGVVRVSTFDSDGAQASHIADIITRKHVKDGVPWSDMAVIVRSAVTSLPAIYRALVSAGVPVEVARDEIPLHQDPAVAPLVLLLRAVDDAQFITPDVAHTLLTGPMAKLDPIDLRRFGRHLRALDRNDERVPRPSQTLIAEVLRNPDQLKRITDSAQQSVVEKVRELGTLITRARESMHSGATPHEVLWQLWTGTSLPETLQQQALGFGGTSQRAHRDLDAICALFDQASRFVSHRGTRDLTVFLDEIEAQQIPAEALAENEIRNDTVRLLTAHRSKGLQWPFVIVAAAQEELWPNLRVPQTLLQPDRIGPREVLMPQTAREILAAERRLFYVAVTRAQDELLITAVETPNLENGSALSRFAVDIMTALDIKEELQHIAGRPPRPLNADGVVAALRSTLADKDASDALKAAAGHRLAKLSRSGNPMFNSANPENWWGLRPLTTNAIAPTEPIHLSASTIKDIEECPAKWYLEHEVQAKSDKGTSMLFGSVIHKIAEGIETGKLSANIEEIDAHLDRIWPGMGFETPWEKEYQRTQAHVVSERLLAWLMTRGEVESISESKLSIKTTVTLTDPSGETESIEISILGFADRIEFRADGVVVFDYKTGKNPEKRLDLPKNLQLALYTFMISNGTYTRDGQELKLAQDATVQGAGLIQLRSVDGSSPELPLLQQVGTGSHDSKSKVTLEERIARAAQIIRDEKFVATPNDFTCSFCNVRFLCPAQAEGRQVL